MEYVILMMLTLINIDGRSIDAREELYRYEVSQELFQVELEKCNERADIATDKLRTPDGRIVALIYCNGGPK